MKMKTLAVMVNAALVAMAVPALADQGPSTSTAPYIVSIAPGVAFTSILTTGDNIGGYKMGGIPDGLGAYDNDDGTFTVLMNHEIFANSKATLTDPIGPVGIVRAHGGRGAYVSEWVIDKKTLQVLSGADLMKSVYQKDASGAWVPVLAALAPTDPSYLSTLGTTSSFARFCSADLADRKAFFNAATRKGTKNRIFLNGEESNPGYQRGLAHVATGPDKGKSFVLPWAASVNASWENFLANPYSGEKTVVIGNADGGTNGVYVYVGTKTNTGNDIEKAGLVGGTLYRVAVNGNNLPETRAADAGLGLTVNAKGNYEGSFSLVAGADAANSASTKFLRPEDGAWDKKDHNRYFFNTTDQMDAAKDGNVNPDIAAGQVGRTRVWALTFTDSSKPELGGKIEMLLDGTSAKGDYQMFDNMSVNEDGSLILLEDVGGNQHNGKIWKLNPADGSLVKLAGHDKALFGDIGVTGSITKDEETSGVIDVTELLDREDDNVYNLFVVQNHALSGDAETVEGGQLLLMTQPAPKHDDGDGHDDGDTRK